jgi:glycine reductase
MEREGLQIVHHSVDGVDAASPPLERGIESVDVEVVRPGDPVRIANVLDAVRPAAKPGDPAAAFPGALGSRDRVGRGRTDVVDGLMLLATCDFSATHDLDALSYRPDGPSIVDMAGPGARYAPWEPCTCVVVNFEADPTVDLESVDRAVRRGALRMACELAATASEAPVQRVERIGVGALAGLPTVAAIVHVGSEGPLLDTFLYGIPLRDADPTLLTVAEILDGALTNGAYDWAALRNPTCLYQTSRLLRRMQAEQGSRLALGGVVVARTYLPTLEAKRRNARLCAEAAQSAGADGVIVTTFQSGNSHTDAMLTIEACETIGIRTVGIIVETDDGLTDAAPSADCLVSAGNEDDLVPSWRPERVVGGEDLGPGPVPALAYLGAMSQLGDGRLRAVSA